MNIEQIKACLDDALKLRVPRFAPDFPPARKISALEHYMLQGAHLDAELVASRHWLRAIRVNLSEQWTRLDGWEVATSRPRGRLTTADIEQAKAKVAPALFDAIHEAKRLSESVDDQIARLERDARTCSRVYSMISGT